MNASTVIRAAELEGLRFEISPIGTPKTAGNNEAIQKWLPTIREYKAEILEALRQTLNSIDPLSAQDVRTG